MVIQNPERAGKVLAEIKKMGVRLAIDDFGVGYSRSRTSALSHRHAQGRRSSSTTCRRTPRTRRSARRSSPWARSLNLTVVAEGVETLEQQTFLHDHACDEMQGFTSASHSGDEFAGLLRQRIQASKQ